jgi:hypothetical protein
MFSRVAKELRTAWSDSAPLTATTLVMLGAFLGSSAGIFLDHRMITGVPAWLKPAKFAISTAIFCATMAWLFRYLTVWRPFVRAMEWVLAIVLVLEVGIIDIQAARGTTSHFNVGTPLDFALFGIMGASIGVLWLASVGVLAVLLRQRFQNPAWGWSLRLGMLITVLGSGAGGLMLRLTPEQAATLHHKHSVTTVGAHTVGALDGGSGLAGLGWSTRHGDLRIPPFFGLHGVQIISFLGWFALRRGRIQSNRQQTELIFATAASYLGFVAILTWQALRGQSIVQPDGMTVSALAVWLGATAVAVLWLRGAGPRERSTENGEVKK